MKARQRRDASHDAHCLHSKSFAWRRRLQVAKLHNSAAQSSHEHSRAHFPILRLRTPTQGVPKGLEQPHEKKRGDLEITTWPRLKCTFYEQNLVNQNQPYFSRFMEGEAEFRAVLLENMASTAVGTHGTPDGLEQAHEKNGPVLLQNVAATPLGTHKHSRVHFLIGLRGTEFRA